MKVLYFDCFSGAAGDMLAGALIDAGACFDIVSEKLASLPLKGFRVQTERLRKQGFAATRFLVELESARDRPLRRPADVRALLEEAPFPESLRSRCNEVFDRLADAEAEAHGISRSEVHFHELGAVDTIVDVVAAITAVEAIAPERVICSPLPFGSGTVTCEHGVMPVPAPATAILLKGLPMVESQEQGELLTPTGAAILTTIADAFGPIPSMVIDRIGMGAGTRDNRLLPNVVRVLVGNATASDGQDRVVILEANIDDAPGEWIGHCVGRLLNEGALDAYCVPIHMKKNRPGVVLTVLCDLQRVDDLESVIFEETSTFGVRRQVASRSTLERRHETVATPYGPIRIKIGRRHGRVTSVSAEFEDCAEAATRHKVSLRAVMDAARQAWHMADDH